MLAETIRWLGGLTVTQGHGSGGALALLPWQRRFIRGALRAGVSTASLSIARGNGKTGLVGAIAAAAAAGPLAVPRGEVVIVASSFGQARVAFSDVRAFLGPAVEGAPRDWNVSDSPQRAEMRHKPTGSTVKAIGSDPRRAHGLRPVLVLADEPAQWPGNTSDAMYSALVTSLGKVEGSRLIALGTRPAESEHWFSRLLDGGADYSQQYAAPSDAPPHLARTWRRANPSAAYWPDLRRAITADARRARADAAALARFRALRLNQGVADVERPVLLGAETWGALEADILPGPTGPLVFGVDLGSSAAMSAIAAYWPMCGRLEVLAAFPETPALAVRGRRDNVGGLYERMAARGELALLGARVVDVAALLGLAMARWGAPAVVVADRWREAELLQALEESGLPPGGLVSRGQGFKDGGEDVRTFRRAAIDGRFATPPSLLMRSAMAEAVVAVDPAGNAKLAKGAQAGRRQAARDDAAAAAILAVAEGERRRQAEERRPRRGVYLGLV